MERIGVLFRLKPGKKEEYQRRHDHIWPEITEALDAAGYRNYSIWNEGDMLFGYYEIKNKERADKILAECEVFAKWRKEMEEYVYIEPGTGKKEWFMERLFYHE